MKKTIIISILAFLLVVGAVSAVTMNIDELYSLLNKQEQEGLLGIGNQPYEATTTAVTAFSNNTVIEPGWGTFGSVIITNAGTASMDFYDATTTDVVSGNSVRSATSSIWLAHMPGSLAAGVYTFDIVFTDGLLVHFGSGGMASTTITYK